MARTTSSVCWPMEPVDPIIASLLTLAITSISYNKKTVEANSATKIGNKKKEGVNTPSLINRFYNVV
jgi:hypothetical protein